TIPNGSVFNTNSVSIDGVNIPGANPQTGINVGSITPGNIVVVKYQVTVVSVPASGKLLNQAVTNYTFTVDPTDPDGRTDGSLSNINSTSVTNAELVGPPGTPGAGYTGSKVGTPQNITIGDIVTYTITAKNSGNVAALNVVVNDTLPQCTTLVNGSVLVNGVPSSDTPETGIYVGTIPAGSTSTVAYKVKVTCLPDSPATLKNQADITYSFITDPSLPPTTVTGPTNPSTIPVTTAGFNINGENGIIKSTDKEYAQRGETVTYTITLTNLGNTAANNVVFKDTIPNDTAFIKDSLYVNGVILNGANPQSGVSIGTIDAGVSVEVKFSIIVLTIPYPNPIPNAAMVSYTYTTNPSIPNGKSGLDLSNLVKTQVNVAMIGNPGAPGTDSSSGILKSASPTYGDIGQTITYTMIVKNTGNTVAKNVIVYDTIAPGSVFINNSVYLDNVISIGSNPEQGIDVGNVDPGQTSTITFQTVVVSIPPSKSLIDTPRVDYTFTVDPTKPDQIVNAGGNTVSIPVNNATISPDDGGFTKSQTPQYATLGDTITYTIKVSNTGTVNATNVTVIDKLNPALSFISNSVLLNGTVLGGVNPNTGIPVGTVAPNAVNTITFKVILSTVPTITPLTNQADVVYKYSPTPGVIVTETVPSPITSTTVSYVDLDGMIKDSDVNYVKVGDIVTYTVTIPNTGNSVANNVTLKDTIPNGSVFNTNSVSIDGVNIPGANPQTGINVGSITPGNIVVVKYQVTVVSVP
ncbi:MAG: hypothetical protein ACRC7N_13475, partial [Clostridium sp.]